MKVNPYIIFLFMLSSLTACEQNNNNGSKIQIKIEDLFSLDGEFNIGLNEYKRVPLFSNEIFSELRKNEPTYLANKVKISFISNNDIKQYIEAKIDTQTNGYEYTVSNCEKEIIFYCKRKFDSPLKIEKLQFETDTYSYTFDFDVTLVFNSDYENYPLFLPTYNCYGLSWNTNIVFGNFLAFNFERLYDLSIDKITINDISFSQNIGEKIDNIYLSIVDKNNDSDFLYSQSELLFEEFREINYSIECGLSKCLIYKINFSEKTENKIMYGDVIFDVSINGINYKIKDLFVF